MKTKDIDTIFGLKFTKLVTQYVNAKIKLGLTNSMARLAGNTRGVRNVTPGVNLGGRKLTHARGIKGAVATA